MKNRELRNLMLATSALGFFCTAGKSGAVTQEINAGAADQVRTSPTAEEPREGEELVVTGTRVSTGNTAPTPLTVLSSERLLETTPSTIPEALNRLPQFVASAPSRNIGQGNENSSGAYLNLRQFGSNRNLILLDGSRLPPTAANGSVDINVLPLALLKRVEVVTGGASAVYGSDAITGVVNFIIDKKFNGLKGTAQAGITKYGDNENVKLSVAGGTDILGGRGHLLGSLEYYNNEGIDRNGYLKRPGYDQFFTQVGAGTDAAPFRLIPNGRIPFVANSAVILSPFIPGLFEVYFPANGVPAQFEHGTNFGQAESGGSGIFNDVSWLATPLRTKGAFVRFDYDVANDTRFFAQGSYNDSYTSYVFSPIYLIPGAVLSGNPFIPPSIQALLTANNVQQISFNTLYGRGASPLPQTKASVESIYFKTGFEGSLFDNTLKWALNYGYGRNTQDVTSTFNVNREKMTAALDAVVDPATGRIVCQVSLTSFASRFPGCEPLNPFGPTAISPSAIRFISDDTRFKRTNAMHDVNLVVSGSPFSSWAGPVQVAVNAQYRHLSLDNDSNVEPTQRPDCTGLRLTLACDLANPFTSTLYNNNISASLSAKQTVKEVGGEVLIPLLRDFTLAKSLELSLAGRYIDYSTSGTVKVWKIGGAWEINDDLRLRGTYSKDIRAPTLQDLFAPETRQQITVFDLHTNSQINNIQQVSRGNSALTPEVAKTKTVGLVYQPHWLPSFTIAIDYYEIKIGNAITPSGPETVFQRECEISNGTSPYCAALVRPLPFSDRSAANLPILAVSQLVNAASQSTRGVDAEINYGMDLDSLFSNAPGRLGLRALVAYQPSLKTQVLKDTTPTNAAGVAGAVGVAGFSKVRVNLGLDYTSEGLNFAITERWQSKQQPSERQRNVDLRPDIGAYAYTDIGVSYRLNVGGNKIVPFVTVENLFNKKPPITGAAGVPGLGQITPAGYDVFGRSFTAGMRFSF